MKVKIVFAALGLLLLASTCLAYDKPTAYIRNCTFHKCGYMKVGQAIDEAFERPSWSSGRASDGQLIVNVEGVVTWEGKRYNVLMQFAPTSKGFNTNGIAFNGRDMGKDFTGRFITALCK